jgi:hypothetical protein
MTKVAPKTGTWRQRNIGHLSAKDRLRVEMIVNHK